MEGCKKQTKGEYGKETLGQIKDDEANKIWTFKTFFDVIRYFTLPVHCSVMCSRSVKLSLQVVRG